MISNKICLTIVLVFGLFINQWAQNANDIIKVKEADEKFLAQLILNKIDSVRNEVKERQLPNDSLVYLVAKSHANFLSENNKSGSNQLNPETRTPSDRMKLFGLGGYGFYELTHSQYVHRPVNVENKKGQKVKVIFETYQQIANNTLEEWLTDPRDLEEIGKHDYRSVGIAVTINPLNDAIKIVCILTKPTLKFTFTESKTMFPYGTYKVDTTKSNTSGKVVPLKDNPFGLKLGNEKACLKCSETSKNIKFQLKVLGSKVFLTASNIPKDIGFDEFLSSSKNGFILEVVDYETFHPGNPDYYEKPGRRNGAGIFNGEVQEPVFGDVASNGYDSEKGTFKIQVGKTPKSLKIFEYNVYLINKGLICHMNRFTEPVGNPMALYNRLNLDYDFDNAKVDYNLQIQELVMKLPLEINSKNVTFKYDTLALKDSLKSFFSNSKILKERIGIIQVNVPIVTEDNQILEDRLNEFLEKLKLSHPEIEWVIEKKENFELFQKEYANTKDPKRKNLGIDEWKKLLSNPEEYKKNLTLLNKSWSGEIVLDAKQDSISAIGNRYHQVLISLDTAKSTRNEWIKEAFSCQKMLIEKYSITKKALPYYCYINKKSKDILPLYNNHWVYLYNVRGNEIESDTLKLVYTSIEELYSSSNPNTRERSNFLKISTNELAEKPYDFTYKSTNYIAELEELKKRISVDEYNELENALDIKNAYYYSNYPKAKMLLDELIEKIFNRYRSNEDKQLELVRTLAYYDRSDKLNELIDPYLLKSTVENRIIILKNKIDQQYIGLFGKIPHSYFDPLLQSYDKLSNEAWCGQFVGKGNISFQVFEYQPLYKKYCEVCNQAMNAVKIYNE